MNGSTKRLYCTLSSSETLQSLYSHLPRLGSEESKVPPLYSSDSVRSQRRSVAHSYRNARFTFRAFKPDGVVQKSVFLSGKK